MKTMVSQNGNGLKTRSAERLLSTLNTIKEYVGRIDQCDPTQARIRLRRFGTLLSALEKRGLLPHAGLNQAGTPLSYGSKSFLMLYHISIEEIPTMASERIIQLLVNGAEGDAVCELAESLHPAVGMYDAYSGRIGRAYDNYAKLSIELAKRCQDGSLEAKQEIEQLFRRHDLSLKKILLDNVNPILIEARKQLSGAFNGSTC